MPSTPKKLGRKYIKSFASGIGYQFAGSAQHYAWLAYHCRCPTVTIDLVALRIEPAAFDIERNRILADMCQAALFRNEAQLASPGAIVSATISATFGIDEHFSDSRGGEWIGRSAFTVVLVDDQGKEWRVDCVEESILIQP